MSAFFMGVEEQLGNVSNPSSRKGSENMVDIEKIKSSSPIIEVARALGIDVPENGMMLLFANLLAGGAYTTRFFGAQYRLQKLLCSFYQCFVRSNPQLCRW